MAAAQTIATIPSSEYPYAITTANHALYYGTCPCFGYGNRHKSQPGSYRFRCQNKPCQRLFEHFRLIRPVCQHRGPGKPRDVIPELAPMPAHLRGFIFPRRELATHGGNMLDLRGSNCDDTDASK